MSEEQLALSATPGPLKHYGANGWTYAASDITPAEVDALRAENARLREALVALLDDSWVHDFGEWFEARLKQAQAALEMKPGEAIE